MKLNLKSWHKVASDKTHTTMRNQRGHELKVAHKGLSRPHRDALKNLPVQLAEGGRVPKAETPKVTRGYQNMANGGRVQVMQDGGRPGSDDGSFIDEMSDPIASEQPDPSQQMQADASLVNPDEKRLQELYNINVAASNMGDPNDPGGLDMMIGGGKDPTNIDPVALQKAQLTLQEDKANKAQQQQAVMAHLHSQNSLRVQAGLAPIPTPPEVVAVPQNSPAMGASSREMTINEPDGLTSTQEVAGLTSTQEVAAPQQPTGMERYQQGVAQQARAIEQQSARDQKILDAEYQQQVKLEGRYNENWESLEASRKELQDDIANSKIDPNRFWDNQNVGQKIGTAIGLILGGMGAGINRTENPVMIMLQKSIDRDIESQKANLGKKQNLLSSNLSQFGNLKDAVAATRMMQNEMVINRLKNSIAQAQGPTAKAQLAQEVGKLESQQGMMQQKFALEQTIQGTASDDPSQVPALIQQIRKHDPKRAAELEGQYVPNMGIALTEKDASTLKEMKGSVDSTLSGISSLKAIISRPGKNFSPAAYAEAEAIIGQLTGPMRQALGLGVMNKSDFELLGRLIPNPAAILSLDTSNAIRLNTLAKRIQEGLKSSATARGIKNYSREKSLAPNERAMVDYARRNPSDPGSQIVLDKLNIFE